MPNINLNCCGAACVQKDGQVRVYPIGGGSNLILCRSCWVHENEYNASRGGERNGFPLRAWDAAEVYPDTSDIPEADEDWFKKAQLKKLQPK